MDRLTSFGDLSGGTAGKAGRVMLETARRIDVTARYSDTNTLPRNAGDTLKARRYEDWPLTESPLSETVGPEILRPTFTDIEVTVEEYGQAMELTQKIADMHEDPVFRIQHQRCSKAAAKCGQRVSFNALKAGSNVVYANSAANRAAVNNTINNNDLKKMERSLNESGVEPVFERVMASTGVSTEPVPEAYLVLCHTSMKSDIRALSGFAPLEDYSSNHKGDPGEVGECEGFRFVANNEAPRVLAAGTSGTTFLSNNAKVSGAAACDVYLNIVMGANTWTRVPLAGSGGAIVPIVINPGKPNVVDKFGRKGMIAWLAYFAAMITWDAGVIRYECAATAL
jgi:N4-gp56 family major capsid protein